MQNQHIDNVSDSRAMAIASLFREGKTYQEIGAMFGITRERVRQVLSKNGISRAEGGQYIKRLSKIAKREKSELEYREKVCKIKFKCSVAEYKESLSSINEKEAAKILRIYKQTKSKASKESVEFGLTFPNLCDLLRGNVHLYGRGSNSLCIHLIDSKKGYHSNNVKLITNSENNSLGGRKKIETLKKRREIKYKRILDMLNDGKSYEHIGEKLNLKTRTVIQYAVLARRTA